MASTATPPSEPIRPRSNVDMPSSSSAHRLPSTPVLNRLNPSAEKARIAVFMVRMRSSRANAASIEIGIGLSSSTTSPSTDFISCRPRLGSGSRNAHNAATSAGIPRIQNAQRHPSSPPATVAMPATTTGLSAPAAREALKLIADIRPRTPIGYVSANKVPLTELLLDLAMPTPKRARKKRKALAARPDATTIAENATCAQPITRLRRNRSAR